MHVAVKAPFVSSISTFTLVVAAALIDRDGRERRALDPRSPSSSKILTRERVGRQAQVDVVVGGVAAHAQLGAEDVGHDRGVGLAPPGSSQERKDE